MPTSVLATKLHAPTARHEIVERPRLRDLLDGVMRSRLALVSAPPGFGKTTVVAHWLRNRRSRPAAAWLSLDASDSHRATFWTYVAAALESARPGLGDRARAMLETPGASVDDALQALLNDLAAVREQVVLVLDDFQVIEGRDVPADVAFVLERLPAQAHIVMITRADPDLPLSRLRARGELVEIRASDLRFTADEAAAYLGDVMGLRLAGSDIDALEARTEGWIAGLQLAALSIRGRDDVAAFIASFAGDDRYIVDYLVDEVLARQSEEVRTFLLRTSILDRFTGRLADALTGRDDGQAMIESLDRANLFLVPLDDRRQWYRYHHLFADVLGVRMQDERAEEVPELHRRASDWFERDGQRAEAIQHALLGGAADRAAELIEHELPTMRRTRREHGLRRWLEALPGSVLEERPVLAAAYAGVLMQIGEFDRVERLLDGVERSLTGAASETVPAPAANIQEFRALPSAIAMYRAALGRAAGDVEATMTHARRALELADPGDPLGRGGPAALLGLAYWEIGDLDSAYRWFADGMASLHRGGFEPDVVGGAVTLADIRIAQGRLGDALKTYEEGLRLATDRDGPPLRGAADMHVGIAGILLERNDLEGAARHLAASRALGDENDLPKNPHRWRIAAARLSAAEGDVDAAHDLLDEAQRVYFSDFSPDARPIAAIRARQWIAQGHLAEARDWVRDRGLTPEDELVYVREFEHATLARLLVAEARRDGVRQPLDEALRLTDRLIETAQAAGHGGAVIDAAVVGAVGRHAAGDRADARQSLARTLSIGEPEGYVRIFLDEGAPMRALLEDAATHGLGQAYVAGLIAASGATPGGAARQSLVEPLSERELEILRLLASDLSGPEIASHLVVSLNTVRSHTKSVYAKLAVNSRRAAVRRATELGLLR